MDSMATKCKLKSVEACLKRENNQPDFKILSEDGKEFKVHSILLHGRGQFFETAITADFKEKKEQELKLPVKSEVVEAMVDFLNGKDLAESVETETLKSLLVDIGEVYDFKGLQRAVIPHLTKKFLRMKTFEIVKEWMFFSDRDCDVGVDLCHYVDLRSSWLRVEMADDAESWRALTEEAFKKDALFKYGYGTNIDMLGFQIHVKALSDVQLVIKHKGEVLETTLFQEKHDMFIDAINVIFKEPCKIRGSELSITASGSGAIGMFDNTTGERLLYHGESRVGDSKLEIFISTQGSTGFIKELFFKAPIPNSN